jgi:Spy/CpxP family protein refolding chaperone
MTNESTFLGSTLIAISLVAAGLLALPAAADPGRQLERMSEELELNSQQRAEIEALFDAHRSRMDELGLDPETRREGRAERHALMQEIQSVLTPEQRQQWMATREQRRQQQGQRGRARLMQALEGMDLNGDQRAAIEALIADARQNRREARQAFMQSLQDILTPEQWAEIEALGPGLRGQGGRRNG